MINGNLFLSDDILMTVGFYYLPSFSGLVKTLTEKELTYLHLNVNSPSAAKLNINEIFLFFAAGWEFHNLLLNFFF